MSFSHMYNLTKSQQYSGQQYEDEEADMGVYGDDVAGASYNQRKRSFEDYKEEEDYDYPAKYKDTNKDDPFAWDNPEPVSKKAESYQNKRQDSEEEFDDTGYDGWNDVKRSTTDSRDIPDPYAKPKPKKAQYWDEGFESQVPRQKAATVVKKDDEFFESGFNKGSSAKKFDFDKAQQPNSFNFDEFGEKLENKKGKGEDFDNIFEEEKPKSSANKTDDPFTWGDDQPKSNKPGNDFDFDFNSGKEKTKEAPKKNVADFLDENTESKEKEEQFDPFADTPANTGKTEDALADIKFEAPPPTQTHINETKSVGALNDTDPVVESEDKTQDNRDPEDLWAKKELFNLSNLSKSKQSKLESKQDETLNNMGSNNLQVNTSSMNHGFNTIDNGQMSAPLAGNSFPGTFDNKPKQPETREDKLNAIESAFGSSELTQPQSQPQAQPQQQPSHQPAQAQPQQTSNDDFGDFPSMFGSTSDGFGNFKGFENDAFGSNTNDPFDAPAQSKPEPKPANTSNTNKQGEDWFEF